VSWIPVRFLSSFSHSSKCHSFDFDTHHKPRIVSKPVKFPSDITISPEAQDIIRQFCTVDRSHRLGNMAGGAQRVKDHPFFRGVLWDEVYYRKYRGPIIPPIRYPGDTQCFDQYPDEKSNREPYTDELSRKWESHFKDF
jgi:protein kinase A